MAKVGVIKFKLKGVDEKANVNCNSSGQFSAKLPTEIAEALRINEELTSTKLTTLEVEFEDCIRKYESIKTTYETFIIVAYQARGKYIERKDGGHLFFYNDDKHKITVSFSEISNAVGLDFEVAIKETIDGKERWFETELGDDGAYTKTNTQIKSSLLKRGKAIPFNKAALDTLNAAQEQFRTLSEILFNFISQDESKILEILTNQKLLTA